MTFFELMRRNAWRKRLRAILLMFSIGVAFLIYGLTASFVAGSQGAAGASDNLLGVFNKAGRGLPLPLAYLSRIAAEDDVAAVAYTARMRGFVEVEKNVVVVSAVEPQAIAAANGEELGLTPELTAALEEGGDRVLVGRALAEAQGWSVGQRIGFTGQLTRADGSRNWNFTIAGIFEGGDAGTDTYFMLARYDALNAARARDKDTVDAFVVRPRPGVSPGILAARIDALFANSAAQTRTQSEKQFLEAFLRQLADVRLIVSLVVGAAFVTILMIAINTMLLARASFRDRRYEGARLFQWADHGACRRRDAVHLRSWRRRGAPSRQARDAFDRAGIRPRFRRDPSHQIFRHHRGARPADRAVACDQRHAPADHQRLQNEIVQCRQRSSRSFS
ncbi:MacB-like transporter protein [Rhizobium sp. Kim5]|nr:MacB-like transporter protein [Rhizobium sp. Kim5]